MRTLITLAVHRSAQSKTGWFFIGLFILLASSLPAAAILPQESPAGKTKPGKSSVCAHLSFGKMLGKLPPRPAQRICRDRESHQLRAGKVTVIMSCFWFQS
jgi:hypothetical protein